MWESGEPAASPLSRRTVSRAGKRAGSMAYPALQLAPHHVRNHCHAAFAVIEAANRREILSAGMVKNLSVFAGDFFQRFAAVGGKPRRDDREAFHAALG